MAPNNEEGITYMNLNNIQMLTGSNFKAWKSGVEFYLMMHENMDLCFTDIEPYGIDANSSPEDKKYYRDWHRSNYRAKNVMRTTMSDTVRGSIDEPALAVDYMDAIAEKFKESNKAEAARLNKEMNELKYTGSGGVRQHILKLTELNARLRDLDMGVKDDQLVHNALDSLPPSFNTLRTSYNAQKENWTLNELIAICVDEESRMKKDKQPSTSINLVEKPKKQNKFKPKKIIAKPSGSTAAAKVNKPFKFKCYFCKKVGHMKKDCTGFKAWLVKKGIHKEEEAKK